MRRSYVIGIAALVMTFAIAEVYADAPQDFVRVTMGALGSVKKLRRGGDGKAHVAVVARASATSQSKAQGLAGLMALDGAAQSLAITTVVAPVNGSTADAERLLALHRKTPLAAVILLDPPHDSMSAIISFASQHEVLTISARPQDTGVVDLVVFEGKVYRYDRKIVSEYVLVENLLSTPVKGQTFRETYEEARNRMEKPSSKPDWGLIAVELQMAIAIGEPPNRIVALAGGQSETYLPHLHLAHALFKLGECEDAEEELKVSTGKETPSKAERADVEKQRPPCPIPPHA